jgi:hypothetical protein
VQLFELDVRRADALPEVPARAEVWRNREGTPVAYGYTEHGQHWISLPEQVAFCVSPETNVVRAVALPEASQDLIVHQFRGRGLPLALQALGWEVMHASAIWTPSGAVAFCGPSGSGKSTHVYAMWRRGYPALGDDAVAFRVSEGRITILPLPFEVKLEPASAEFFTRKGGLNGDLPEARPEPSSFSTLFALEQVDAAEVDGFEITKLPLAPALKTFLINSYCFDPRDEARRADMVLRYLELVGQVPTFRLRYSPDFDRLPDVLDAIEHLIDVQRG